MMDPLSITLACVTLLTATTRVAQLITTFVKGTREARRDVDAFNRELSSLVLCVAMLKDEEFKFPDQLQRNLISVLADCGVVIDSMEALLKKQGERSLEKSIKWSTGDRDEVMSLRSRLEAHKATLDITLDMANLVTIMAVKEDTTIIREDTAAIKEDTVDIKAELEYLRAEVSLFRLQQAGDHPILNRFLSEAVTYTESVLDPLECSTDPPKSLGFDHDHWVESTESFHTIKFGEGLSSLSPEMPQAAEISEPPTQSSKLSQKSGSSPDPSQESGNDGAFPCNSKSSAHTDMRDPNKGRELLPTETSFATNNDQQRGYRDVGAHLSGLPKVLGDLHRPLMNDQNDCHSEDIAETGSPKTGRSGNSSFITQSTESSFKNDQHSIEAHVSSVLRNCGSSIEDKEGALLWYMLETWNSDQDELPRITWILEQGININAWMVDEMEERRVQLSGWTELSTALHLAALWVNSPSGLIELLVKLGADLEADARMFPDDDSAQRGPLCPLFAAVYAGNFASIATLIASGASTRLFDKKGLVSFSQWAVPRAVCGAQWSGGITDLAQDHGLQIWRKGEPSARVSFKDALNEFFRTHELWCNSEQMNATLTEIHYRRLLQCFGLQADADGEWRRYECNSLHLADEKTQGIIADSLIGLKTTRSSIVEVSDPTPKREKGGAGVMKGQRRKKGILRWRKD